MGSLIEILGEALKICTKNGRLMGFIAIFTAFIQTVLYLANIFTLLPLISDWVLHKTLLYLYTPDTQQFNNALTIMKKDISMFIAFELLYIILYSIAFLLSSTATVIASVSIYGGKEDLSVKDLVLRTVKTWFRPLITWLCVSLLSIAYIIVPTFIILVTVFTVQNHVVRAVLAVFLGLLTLLNIYLYVTWVLAIVVSAIEETRGFKAIKKASDLVKGMRLEGFLLNLLFNVLSGVLMIVLNRVIKTQSLVVYISVALVVLNLASLTRIYWFITLTVLYFRCKKIHGENVEMIETFDGYSKLSSIVEDSLP